MQEQNESGGTKHLHLAHGEAPQEGGEHKSQLAFGAVTVGKL